MNQIKLTEKEKHTQEVGLLVYHGKNILSRSPFLLQIIQTPEFIPLIRSLPSTICQNCGDEFHIIHWCDVTGQNIWSKNWLPQLEEVCKPLIEEENRKKKELEHKFTLEQVKSEIDIQNEKDGKTTQIIEEYKVPDKNRGDPIRVMCIIVVWTLLFIILGLWGRFT